MPGSYDVWKSAPQRMPSALPWLGMNTPARECLLVRDECFGWVFGFLLGRPFVTVVYYAVSFGVYRAPLFESSFSTKKL